MVYEQACKIEIERMEWTGKMIGSMFGGRKQSIAMVDINKGKPPTSKQLQAMGFGKIKRVPK